MKKDNYKKGLVLLCVLIIVIITIMGYYASKKIEASNNSDIEDNTSSENNDETNNKTNDETNADGKQKSTEHPEEIKKIMVDISGCVKNPGLYELDTGARVDDIIAKAGGFTEEAHADYIAKNINLAKLLQDEDKIYIPSKDENINELEEELKNNDSTYTTGKININSATKEQLMTLKGIGESYADRIIEYRSKQKFNSIEDIMNVSGIGEKKFENLKEYIKVE